MTETPLKLLFLPQGEWLLLRNKKMNILLFEQHEQNADRLLLTDHRAKHIRTVLKLKLGDTLRIGMVNSKMGQGKIISMDDNTVELEVKLDYPPHHLLKSN